MIPNEVLHDFINGFDNEEEQIEAIKIYLRTPAQRRWLAENDLSLNDILSGHYTKKHEKGILAMFKAWNAILNHKVFMG